jgi:hypothetical protein
MLFNATFNNISVISWSVSDDRSSGELRLEKQIMVRDSFFYSQNI